MKQYLVLVVLFLSFNIFSQSKFENMREIIENSAKRDLKGYKLHGNNLMSYLRVKEKDLSLGVVELLNKLRKSEYFCYSPECYFRFYLVACTNQPNEVILKIYQDNTIDKKCIDPERRPEKIIKKHIKSIKSDGNISNVQYFDYKIEDVTSFSSEIIFTKKQVGEALFIAFGYEK